MKFENITVIVFIGSMALLKGTFMAGIKPVELKSGNF